MGGGSLLYMHSSEVEQIGPDQLEDYHLLCLRWLIQLVLDQLGRAVLWVSLVGFPVNSQSVC